MKIKRKKSVQLLLAIQQLVMDMIPSSRRLIKDFKEEISEIVNKYFEDLDPIVEEYGRMVAPIIQDMGNHIAVVGKAYRKKIKGVNYWYDVTNNKKVEYNQVGFLQWSFDPIETDDNKAAEIVEKYQKAKEDIDEQEVDVKSKPIYEEQLLRFDVQNNKVAINLPAAADPLLGVFILSTEEEKK